MATTEDEMGIIDEGTGQGSLLRPPRKARLGTQVASILRRYIVLGELAPGDKLPSERKLSRRLGVSHRVVRDALAQLSGEGLVVTEHGRGTFVRPFDRAVAVASVAEASPADATDLMEARAALECGIIPLVVERATEEDLDRLEVILGQERERYARGESPAAEDIRFHTTLLRLTRNRTLAGFGSVITSSLRENIYRTPALVQSAPYEDDFAMQTHAEIVAALRARDVDRGIKAVIRHLRRLESFP